MIRLKCPSCGAALEIPDGRGVANCAYCGTRILLEPAPGIRDQAQHSHYTELAGVALQAGNYSEAIQYCNKALELAPQSGQIWALKAMATIRLTTAEAGRYDEAVSYLQRASQFAPGDQRVARAVHDVSQYQAYFCNSLGDAAFKEGVRIWKTWNDGSVEGKARAIRESSPVFIGAMYHFVDALQCLPEDMTVLENIERLVLKTKDIVTWGATTQANLQTLERLRERARAAKRLPKLEDELRSAEEALARLRASTGVLVRPKVRLAQKQIERLKASIAECQQAAIGRVSPTGDRGPVQKS